ncbi:hypothetical protein C8R45DRAFT_1089237 [Mycena sanguinolenta]|nr:hypothetical protein C8R45DRAFT_1089237 [Mycena sanguinolenta]
MKSMRSTFSRRGIREDGMKLGTKTGWELHRDESTKFLPRPIVLATWTNTGGLLSAYFPSFPFDRKPLIVGGCLRSPRFLAFTAPSKDTVCCTTNRGGKRTPASLVMTTRIRGYAVPRRSKSTTTSMGEHEHQNEHAHVHPDPGPSSASAAQVLRLDSRGGRGRPPPHSLSSTTLPLYPSSSDCSHHDRLWSRRRRRGHGHG